MGEARPTALLKRHLLLVMNATVLVSVGLLHCHWVHPLVVMGLIHRLVYF